MHVFSNQIPFTGEVLAFSVCDAHISMRLKLSPAWFEDVIQSVTKGILFHRPDLFFSKENEALLYSYLDEMPSSDPELHKNLTYVKHYEGDVEDLGLTFSFDQVSHKYGFPNKYDYIPSEYNYNYIPEILYFSAV